MEGVGERVSGTRRQRGTAPLEKYHVTHRSRARGGAGGGRGDGRDLDDAAAGDLLRAGDCGDCLGGVEEERRDPSAAEGCGRTSEWRRQRR